MKTITLQQVQVIAILTSIFLAGNVFAQTTATTLPEPTLTSASPTYFVEQIGEGIVTLFTVDPVAKVERYAMLSQERLAEATVLAEMDNTSGVEKTTTRYLRQYNAAATLVTDPNSSIDSATKLELQTGLVQDATSGMRTLDTIAERVPEATYTVGLVNDQMLAKQVGLITNIAEKDAVRATELYVTAVDSTVASITARADAVETTSDVAGLDASIKDFNMYVDLGTTLSQQSATESAAVRTAVAQGTASIADSLTSVQTRVPIVTTSATGSVTATQTTTGGGTNVSNSTGSTTTTTTSATSGSSSVYRSESGITWQEWYIQTRVQ